MKNGHLLPFLTLIVCISFSCTSKEKADTTRKDTVVTREVSLFFAGDLMQHMPQVYAARQVDGSFDYTPCFEAMKPLITAADIAIGNFETTLAGEPYTGYPCFSAPDAFLTAVKEAGFDVMLTANNHCCDKGKKGIERTLMMMDSLKMRHLGTYRDSSERAQQVPLMLNKNGIKIALLNYTYGTNGIRVPSPCQVNLIDTLIIYKDIARARKSHPDVVIACLHWGLEYQLKPSKGQRELTAWLLKNGVDHIIGSHPHVPQPLEVVDSTGTPHLIAYSLGNFVSNQSDPHTNEGYTIRIDFKKTGKQRAVLSNYEQTYYFVSKHATNGRRQYRILPISHPDSCLNSAEQRQKEQTTLFWKQRD